VNEPLGIRGIRARIRDDVNRAAFATASSAPVAIDRLRPTWGVPVRIASPGDGHLAARPSFEIARRASVAIDRLRPTWGAPSRRIARCA